MKIRPGVLVQNIDDFYKHINTLKPYFKKIHIDIADGILVPNTTISVHDILSTINSHLADLTDLSFDFHLMVKDYKKNLEEIAKLKKVLNIQTILIHVSVVKNFERIVKNYPFFSLGIVLDTQDSVETTRMKINLDKIPIIQIMTVNAGFQGQSLNFDSLNKVRQLRDAGYRNIITIDGGVSETTIPHILSLGFKPDRLDGVGSFFLKAKDIKERIEFLKKYNCY